MDYSAYPPKLRELLRLFDEEITALFKQLREGLLAPADWKAATERVIARYLPAALMAGAKTTALLPDQVAAIQERLGIQLGYFNNFSDIVARGVAMQTEFVPERGGAGAARHYLAEPPTVPWKQYEARLRSYVRSAVAPYWDGATGALPLPAIPADGSSQCVVSPEARVKTTRGWVPIRYVHTGDRVLTHAHRYRLVSAAWTSQAGPDREVYQVCVPGMNPVLFTGDHRLLTAQGWMRLDHIYTSGANVLYSTHVYHQNHLMPLRESEGPSGGALPILPQSPANDPAMGRPPLSREADGESVSTGAQAQGLQTPVYQNLGGGEWAGSARVCDPPQGRQPQERGFIQPDLTDRSRTPDAPYPHAQAGHLPGVRDAVQAPGQGPETGGAKILFCGVLPPDTTLYDLTVEGDESFVIESIFAHNCGQGCKCAWEIRPLDAAKGDFDCYWRLRPAEHCQTCRVRARDWYPLRVRGWQLVVPEERTFREAQTSLKQAFAALGLPAERLKGGPGSGHFGHAGRPGKHGGSLPGNVALGIHASPEARLQRIAAAYARTLATLRRGGADAGQIAALARRALAKIDAFSTDENAAAAHALDDLHTWGDRKLFTQEDYLREGSRRLAQVTELHKLREGALRTVLMEGLALPEGAAYAPQIRTYFIGQLTTTPHYAAYLEGVGQLLRLVPAARVDARIPNPFIGGARSAGDALAINIGLVGSGSGEYIPSSDTISINPAAEYAGGLDFTRSAVVHEVAHWLTARMPGVYAASRAEFARRTANEPAVVDPRTRTFTKKDQFLDPYMGRLYSQYSAADGTGRIFREPSRESLDGCELISTAAEHFYRTPAQLLQRDPQTFHFLLTTLFGVPPGGAE